MSPDFGSFVYKLFTAALDLKDRVDRAEPLDFEQERNRLLNMIEKEKSRQPADYRGDGIFLGVRYALTCWVDELFIIHSPISWADQWKGKARILEDEIFQTNLAATRFWEQADIVLGRPNALKPKVAPGMDALEAFFLCVVLGFRGEYYDNVPLVREYIEEMRNKLTYAAPFQALRDRGVQTNVEPLDGHAVLRRVVGVYGGMALVSVLVLLIISRFLG
jgi:type VI secretion system protein ImpK